MSVDEQNKIKERELRYKSIEARSKVIMAGAAIASAIAAFLGLRNVIGNANQPTIQPAPSLSPQPVPPAPAQSAPVPQPIPIPPPQTIIVPAPPAKQVAPVTPTTPRTGDDDGQDDDRRGED